MSSLRGFAVRFFAFSAGERRGVLLLLPLLLVIGLLVLVARRPAGERNLEMLADAKMEQPRGDNRGGGAFGRDFTGEEAPQAGKPFVFDPNTIDLEGLCRLGFTKKEAAGILSYRKGGKVFHDEYDFAGCWQVSMEMFRRLEGYIVIGEKFRRPPRPDRPSAEAPRAARVEPTEPFDPNTLDVEGFVRLGFSPRQSEVIVDYRDRMGGFRRADDLARCYVVSPEAFERLAPWIAIAPKPKPEKIDVNRADSATLCTVSGIGPTTAGRIVEMRRRLGGFASVAQLAQVPGVTEQNFERFSKEIFASNDGIHKIDINFATSGELIHPLIPATVLRKLLKQRQLKGGWTSIEDMVSDDIMTAEQARRLAPYLVFTPAQ